MKCAIISVRKDKVTAMLPSGKDIQRLLKALKKYGVDVKIELLSRCG